MNRIAAALLFLSTIARADDAADLLAKAHAAFIDNHKNERFWNWTTITTRKVLDKDDQVLEELPSVTVESPINSEGKRCNAVLAWGDGTTPYLANASADQRCAVETETVALFTIEALLQSKTVKVQSQTAGEIVLAIRQNKALTNSPDLAARCVASVEATVILDAATSFPKKIDVKVPNTGCDKSRTNVQDHYDDVQIKNARNGFRKGTRIHYEFELRHDKSGGDKSGSRENRDFWIRSRTHTTRPLEGGAAAIIVSGRKLSIESRGSDRKLVVETRTSASQLSAESTVTFEP